MYKKILLLVVSCLLFMSVESVVLAADINELPDSRGYEIIEDDNGFATKAEVVEALSSLVDDPTQISISSNDEYISTKVFLSALAELRNYCGIIDGKLVYPMGDSIWLSAEEWDELVKNLYSPISMKTVNTIIQRTIETDEFVKTHNIPVSYEYYKETIEAFYGEFLDLLKSNAAAAKYWVKELNRNTIYDPEKFSSLLHEIAHEQSAKKSGAFEKRYVTADTWGVYWGNIPNHIWPYDPKTKENTEIAMLSIPRTLSLVKEQSIPEEVQKTIWYKVYSKSDSMSNKIGVYGMLEEFCASSIDLRARVIESSLHGKQDCFYEDALQGVYFWEGTIGQYLIDLKRSSPNVYNQLISSNFSDLLRDTMEYIDEQINLVHVVSTDTESVIALREWSQTPEIQNILQECILGSTVS